MKPRRRTRCPTRDAHRLAAAYRTLADVHHRTDSHTAARDCLALAAALTGPGFSGWDLIAAHWQQVVTADTTRQDG